MIDREQLIELFGNKKYVNNMLKQKGIPVVIKKDGDKIIGALKLKRKREHIGGMGMIVVHSDYRGKGIATELYKQAIAIFIEEGRTKITDNVEGDNPAMERILIKLGFEKEGILKCHTHDKKDVSMWAKFI